MKSVKKTQFAWLNDKRFYFHGGIVSLPSGHALLKILRKEKEKYRYNIPNKIHKKRLSGESKAVRKCERLRILRSIYLQAPLLYLLDSEDLMKIRDFKSTREQILNGSWK